MVRMMKNWNSISYLFIVFVFAFSCSQSDRGVEESPIDKYYLFPENNLFTSDEVIEKEELDFVCDSFYSDSNSIHRVVCNESNINRAVYFQYDSNGELIKLVAKTNGKADGILLSLEEDTLHTQYCIAGKIYYDGKEKGDILVKGTLCPRVITEKYKYEIGDTIIFDVFIPYMKLGWFDYLKFQYLILNTDGVDNYEFDEVSSITSYEEKYIYPQRNTQITYIPTKKGTYHMHGYFSIINSTNSVLEIDEGDINIQKFVVE